MFTSQYKSFFTRLITPLARGVARTGISPNVLTLATPVLALAVSWWLLHGGSVVVGGLLMAVVVCLDWLDGAVARITGRESRFGAYLDAMTDRYVEVILAITVAALSGYWLLTMMAISGALLVSYSKARAAMEVSVNNLGWPDLMERTERGLLFFFGMLAWVLIPWRPFGRDLLWWTLLLMALLTHLTVLQRVLRARRVITAGERGGGSSENGP